MVLWDATFKEKAAGGCLDVDRLHAGRVTTINTPSCRAWRSPCDKALHHRGFGLTREAQHGSLNYTRELPKRHRDRLLSTATT